MRKGDKAYWNGGKLRIDRYRAVKVFDGSNDENWSWVGTNTTDKKRRSIKTLTNIVKASSNANVLEVFCNAYIAKSANQTYGLNEGIGIDSSGWLLIYDENYNTQDSSLWIAHLAENPITVEYPLATPITEEIDIDLGELTMFYPTTILSNDCNANMEVTYIADTKAYVDKKVMEVITAML